MSARSCRKPRSCKTQSSLSAGTQVWERSHRSLCPGLQDMQKPVGFQAKGKLQDWAPPPRPLPLCHAPSWPPSSGSFSTLQPWDPLPSLPSKAELLKAFFWGWGRLGALGASRGPSVLCHSLPRYCSGWQLSQKPLLGSVLRFPHGESDTVRELRSRQAQVTPSVPLSLSVYVCL